MKTWHYKSYTNTPFFNHHFFFFFPMALQHSIQTQSLTSIAHHIFKSSWVYTQEYLQLPRDTNAIKVCTQKGVFQVTHWAFQNTQGYAWHSSNLCSSHVLDLLPLLCIHFRLCIKEACGFGDICIKSTNRIVLFHKSVVQAKMTKTVCAQYVFFRAFWIQEA